MLDVCKTEDDHQRNKGKDLAYTTEVRPAMVFGWETKRQELDLATAELKMLPFSVHTWA